MYGGEAIWRPEPSRLIMGQSFSKRHKLAAIFQLTLVDLIVNNTSLIKTNHSSSIATVALPLWYPIQKAEGCSVRSSHNFQMSAKRVVKSYVVTSSKLHNTIC